MSVIEQIVENANALTPAAQRRLLWVAERLRRKEASPDTPLDQWAVGASKTTAFIGLPPNEWDDVYEKWIAEHGSDDQAR